MAGEGREGARRDSLGSRDRQRRAGPSPDPAGHGTVQVSDTGQPRFRTWPAGPYVIIVAPLATSGGAVENREVEAI
ncbi:hypothetical protein GCM10023096_33670 [Nonomuraea ferruginea]